MTIFPDLDQFFEGTLTLPIKGKNYTVQPPAYHVGMYVQRLIEAGAAVASGRIATDDMPKIDLNDGEEFDLYETICGATIAELKADNVPWPKIQIFANTVFIWIGMGEQAALAFWRSGGDPKAGLLPANREQRRAEESKRTDAASTTTGQGSTSGMRPPNTSSRRRRNRH